MAVAKLRRGDRIKWGDVFGYVGTALQVIRGPERAHYARLALDDGRDVLITPASDTTPLALIWRSGGNNLRLVRSA